MSAQVLRRGQAEAAILLHGVGAPSNGGDAATDGPRDLWLRHELFRGRLSTGEFQASEANLVELIQARGSTKPHLADLM
jgi:hypothetical protein